MSGHSVRHLAFGIEGGELNAPKGPFKWFQGGPPKKEKRHFLTPQRCHFPDFPILTSVGGPWDGKPHGPGPRNTHGRVRMWITWFMSPACSVPGPPKFGSNLLLQSRLVSILCKGSNNNTEFPKSDRLQTPQNVVALILLLVRTRSFPTTVCCEAR